MNDLVAGVALSLLGLLVGLSVAWVGRDAAKRGRSAPVVMALCILTWPIGFLIWRELRPPPLLPGVHPPPG